MSGLIIAFLADFCGNPILPMRVAQRIIGRRQNLRDAAMSLWAEGEKKNGKRPLYSIGGLDTFSVLFGAIFVSSLLLPLLAMVIRTLRSLLH